MTVQTLEDQADEAQETGAGLCPPELRALFLVWGAPQGSHRSQFFARELGIAVEHVYLTARQGRLYAIPKYLYQAFQTLRLLFQRRPRLVFVQDPPVFAALTVDLYCALTKARFIIDSHTDALLAPWWAWSLPLHGFLSRRALANLVTNEHLAEIISQWGARAFVLYDPPIMRPPLAALPVEPDRFHVMVVSTVSYDEPVQQVLEAAAELPNVRFHITGKYLQLRPDLVAAAPPNVQFTGFIPDEQFYGLMQAVQAVMCLTTENYTFQSGANEALWLGKPVITSDWPVLRQCFSRGTIHVDNSPAAIRQAVCEMMAYLQDYQDGIYLLQIERRLDWYMKVTELIRLAQAEPVGGGKK